ncbi:MAG TPA: hypothetical protein VN642_06075 [Dongiaceae bacterium]|nr:hypothetical protein [Dongiaceae bacterium]
MKTLGMILIALLMVFTSSAFAVEKPITSFSYLGTWSNVKISQSEEPHAEGFSVSLLQVDGKTVGTLRHYVGTPFDAPVGELQEVSLDHDTGKISFAAKLTTGSIFSGSDDKLEPSMDFYTFEGTVSAAKLIGTFTMKRLNPTRRPKKPGTVDVILLSDNYENEFWKKIDYKEWKKLQAEAIRATGPKW